MLVPCTGYQEARYTERAFKSARLSCTNGAPSRIASSAVNTAGISSYSTSINDSASSAVSSSTAATAATGWPTKRTFSIAKICSSSTA